MARIPELVTIIHLSILLIACVGQERNPGLLTRVADKIPLPPGTTLLDTKITAESRHPDRECWTHGVGRIYASDAMTFEEVLDWFEDNINAQEWSAKIWRSDRLLQYITGDGVALIISDDYRFVVFPAVNAKDEEKKHKALFYIGLTRRIYPATKTLSCT
jgi:hypothetical protein